MLGQIIKAKAKAKKLKNDIAKHEKTIKAAAKAAEKLAVIGFFFLAGSQSLIAVPFVAYTSSWS